MAFTFKIRGGKTGGGKGLLIQEELSATLSTHSDQSLYKEGDGDMEGLTVRRLTVGVRAASGFPGRLDGYSLERQGACAGQPAI